MQNIEKIYEEYSKIVYKYLFCLTNNKDISEELTQETFYKAILKIDTFKGKCKMSVWLCQIARNLWYNTYKKQKKIKIVEASELEVIPDIISTEEQIIENEEKRDFYQKLSKLDKNIRDVIYLRIHGNLSFKEIAEILGKTEGAVRVMFYRGKQQLKEGDENGKQNNL